MNKPNPLISVIVPSYNRARIIPQTIENILAQTFKNFELIVVDDGSTDGTKEVLEPYFDRIIYIKQENKGITGARNTGIEAARGEWIALQDSDDLWDARKLEQQVSDLRQNPGLDVYFVEAVLQRPHLGRDVLSYTHSGFSKHLDEEAFTVIERPLHYHIKYGIAWVQATLVRKQLLFDVGLYDEWLTLYTDFDLFCRLALRGPWGFNPQPLVTIQRVPNDRGYISSQRTKTPAKGFRNMAYILEKTLRSPDLNADEVSVIGKKLADAYSGLGNELLRSGDAQGARICFSNALRHRNDKKLRIKLAASRCIPTLRVNPFRPVDQRAQLHA